MTQSKEKDKQWRDLAESAQIKIEAYQKKVDSWSIKRVKTNEKKHNGDKSSKMAGRNEAMRSLKLLIDLLQNFSLLDTVL